MVILRNGIGFKVTIEEIGHTNRGQGITIQRAGANEKKFLGNVNAPMKCHFEEKPAIKLKKRNSFRDSDSFYINPLVCNISQLR